MPSKKTSSVVLTPEAQKIKDRIAGAFSLKGIFSAGIIWFNRLDTETMIDIVSAAKKNAPLLGLIEGLDHSKKIEKAVAFIGKNRRDCSRLGMADEEGLWEEALNILTEQEPEEKPAGGTQGQVSKAVTVLKKMSADGLLSVEFLSDEDQKVIDELAKLVRQERKKSHKGKTA